jgi:hypothetical protein
MRPESMNTDTFVALVWSLAAGALCLALSAIPLAYRRVSRALWTAHAALAIALALTVAAAAHVTVFAPLVPWWRTGVAYLATFAAPVLATAWSARAAHRRWSAAAPWRVAVAALAALLGCVAAGGLVATAALPVLMHAVQ